MGNIYFRQGEWQRASDAYDLAIQSAETSRSWATDEQSRQRILREAISIYQNTVQAYINLGQIDKAITTSERTRSRQLVDLMATQNLYPNAEIPATVKELLAKYQNINNKIRNYQALNSNQNLELTGTNRASRDSHTFATDTAAILELTTEKNRIWKEIRQNDPLIAGQIQVNPIDLPAIQTLLSDSHTAILSFYTTDTNTYIFIITCDNPPQIHTCKKRGRDELQPWLATTWLSAYLNDPDTWQQNIPSILEELSQRLDLDTLVTNLTGINELILIPHLYLHQIPFAALPLEDGYLGDRFVIRYAPSCQILKYCHDRDPIESPIYGTIEDADGTLPGAGFEGHQIATLYQIPPEYRLRGKAQASIQNYQRLLTQATNIHSAHHASFNLGNPLESHLQLADGNISLGDLLTTRYPHLNEVFLSCCETNLGTTDFTDDLLTLGTAFLCSGARSVISTLWMVNDVSTCIFSILYYQRRQEGIDRAVAIQQAQQELRTMTGLQLKPFITAIDNYREVLKTEYHELENAPSSEAHEQIREDLYKAMHTAKTLRSDLGRYLRSYQDEHLFADPYYWAGFTCQGLG